jgi:hypothetical protein
MSGGPWGDQEMDTLLSVACDHLATSASPNIEDVIRRARRRRAARVTSLAVAVLIVVGPLMLLISQLVGGMDG